MGAEKTDNLKKKKTETETEAETGIVIDRQASVFLIRFLGWKWGVAITVDLWHVCLLNNPFKMRSTITELNFDWLKSIIIVDLALINLKIGVLNLDPLFILIGQLYNLKQFLKHVVCMYFSVNRNCEFNWYSLGDFSCTTSFCQIMLDQYENLLIFGDHKQWLSATLWRMSNEESKSPACATCGDILALFVLCSRLRTKLKIERHHYLSPNAHNLVESRVERDLDPIAIHQACSLGDKSSLSPHWAVP